MNFASLLKNHQNRFNNSTHNHQQQMIKINCNINKNQNNRSPFNNNFYNQNQSHYQPSPVVENYFSSSKKRIVNEQNILLRMHEIYDKYQQDPTTQWILQSQPQLNRLKLHKFKPNKIKGSRRTQFNTQNQHSSNYNASQNHPIHRMNNMNKGKSNISDMNRVDINNMYSFDDSSYHQTSLCSQNQLNHNQQIVNQNTIYINNTHHQDRRNYSPMQRLNPRQFNINKNKDERFNSNKGHQNKVNDNDNQRNVNVIDNKLSFGQENNIWKDQSQHQENHNEKQDNHIEGNSQNKGVNLLQKFNQSQTQNNQKENNSIAQPIQTIEKELIAVDKNNQSINFSLDMGIQLTQKQPNQVNSTKVENPADLFQFSNSLSQLKTQSTTFKTQPIMAATPSNLKTAIVAPSDLTTNCKQQKCSQNLQKQLQATPIKIIPLTQQNSTNINFNITRDRSPNHIVCKANVKNLTPQKVKNLSTTPQMVKNLSIVPESNTNLNKHNPASQNPTAITKSKTQTFIDLNNKNVLNNSQNVSNNPNNCEQLQIQDKIRKIVIFQSFNKDQQKQSIVQTLRNNKLMGPSNMNQQNSPGSRPKLFNQLANLEMTSTINLNQAHQPIKELSYDKKIPTANDNKTLNKTQNNIVLGGVKNFTDTKPNNLTDPKINLTETKLNNNNYIRYGQRPSLSPNQPNQQLPVPNIANTLVDANNKNYSYKPLSVGPLTYNNLTTNNNLPQYQPYQNLNQVIPQQQQNIIPTQHQIINRAPLSNINNAPVMQTRKVISPYEPYFSPTSNTQNQQPAPLSNNAYQFSSTTTRTNLTPPKPYVYQPYQPSYQNYSNNGQVKINTVQAQPPTITINKQTIVSNAAQQNINSNAMMSNNNNGNFLQVEGIKHAQSKIYEYCPELDNSSQNLEIGTGNRIRQDPKETSIQFSLRIDEHFQCLNLPLK